MRNFRNFGITFAVSLVILGIVALFACGFVADTVAGIFNNRGKELDEILNASTEPTNGSSEEQDERFTRELNGSSFTWMMVVTDKRTDIYDNYFPEKKDIEASTEAGILGKEYRYEEADAIAVVRADVETRDYVILTIPSITKVETGSGAHTLGEVYALYGIQYLSDKVGSMIGLKVDYYTVMNCTELASLASTIGAVECEIPVKICYNGKEYISAPPDDTTTVITEPETTGEEEAETAPPITDEIDAATSVKVSKKLQAAILYRDWSDGVEQEMTILSSFVRGVLNNISSYSDKSLESALSGLKTKIKETNITSADIQSVGEVIRAYTWLGRQTIVYPGRLVSASGDKNAYYTPDVNKAMEYFYNYR